MVIRGTITAEGTGFNIVIDEANVFTFGETREEALAAAKDALCLLLSDHFDCDYDASKISVEDNGRDSFDISAPTRDLVGLVIKQLRGRMERTQKDVAENMGVTRNCVVQYEHGKTDPSIDQLERIMHAMGYKMIISIEKEAS